MGLFIIERIKEQFGKEKEAVELYEKITGKNVSELYKDTFLGEVQQKGTLYEFYIFKHLYKIKGYSRFLFNTYLKTSKGLTEIDVIFIHEKGIFVFECKNYGGKIYGKEEYKNWIQYVGKEKNYFYNPILQNKGHINAMKPYLTETEFNSIFSFITFSSRVEMNIEFDPKRLMVADTDGCILELEILLNKKLSVIFNKEQVDEIYNKLNTIVSEEEKQEHIKRVQSNKS